MSLALKLLLLLAAAAADGFFMKLDEDDESFSCSLALLLLLLDEPTSVNSFRLIRFEFPVLFGLLLFDESSFF